MESLKFALELLNGTTTLLSFFLLIWLSFYLYERYHERDGVTLWSMFFGISGAVSLALYLYIEELGLFLTRLVVWVWRMDGAEHPFTDTQNIVFITGGFLFSLAILLMIRVLSRPRFGEWPWFMAGLITTVYVVTRSIVHYS
jgi:hypothetical protein